jgi:hypothetical protein
MLTKSVKWIAIAALFLIVLWLSSFSYQLMLAALFLGVFVFPVGIFLRLSLVCLVTVMVSLSVLKAVSRLFIPSITRQITGSVLL